MLIGGSPPRTRSAIVHPVAWASRSSGCPLSRSASARTSLGAAPDGMLPSGPPLGWRASTAARSRRCPRAPGARSPRIGATTGGAAAGTGATSGWVSACWCVTGRFFHAGGGGATPPVPSLLVTMPAQAAGRKAIDDAKSDFSQAMFRDVPDWSLANDDERLALIEEGHRSQLLWAAGPASATPSPGRSTATATSGRAAWTGAPTPRTCRRPPGATRSSSRTCSRSSGPTSRRTRTAWWRSSPSSASSRRSTSSDRGVRPSAS